MAGALIGEAFLSASFQVLCDRISSREFLALFLKKKLDESLTMKLKTVLLTLGAVLNDAEEKQISNPAVKGWLDELRHAVFDADDLLDEINTEALRSKLEGGDQPDSLTNQVWSLFSTFSNHHQSMNAKMEELLQRLENFVQQKSALGLRDDVGRKVSHTSRPTTSLVHQSSCVYGRDGERDKLSKLLLSDDASNEDVSVIPIVGMGGVGKTTLARLLYNDDKVTQNFTLKAWACVSEDYDVVRVTRTLLESVTSMPCNLTNPNLDLLQLELREQVRGKKFFFVLDDLWNESYIDWKCLQTPLTSGARGSKVIVTTRNNNVASVLKTVPAQNLQPLTHEDCWSLLAKHAFGNESHAREPDLEEIGKQIARKCGGLPLAAETLGGLLRSKTDIEEWKSVLESRIWELPYGKSNILPALGLSYHYLSAQLKRCFVYCSVFPKDYEFDREDVILLWMAEGLVPEVENGKRMEEVAKEYFDELLSRSLFQKSWGWYFTMHDLVNDLATFMSGGFCFRLEGSESDVVPQRVRHMSYCTRGVDAASTYEPFKEAKCLRTFLPISYRYELVLKDLVSSLSCLRVLKLSRYQNVRELPDSIGNLVHLRYLDLSYTAVERLPDAVCTLYNLQTLLLVDCSSLIELPVEMRKLINLRHLDITRTKLKEMPQQISRLKSLRTLTAFAVGKSSGSRIGELKELSDLQGKLSIMNLQNLVDARDALQANLKDKKHLKHVELAWGDEDTNDSQKERDVLDMLQPSIKVEKLAIRFYGGTSFPNWIGDSAYCNIQFMSLSDCRYCWSLPPLGQLPALRNLCITRMKLVERVGVEFYCGIGSSAIQPFRSLESLWFEGMPEWEEWLPSSSEGQFPDFPLLQDLTIQDCPKLRGNLPIHLPCLKRLTVSGCGVLHDARAFSTTSSLNNNINYSHKSLEQLEIADGCPELLSLLDTEFLSRLYIRNFADMQCFPNSSRLLSLRLDNCPSLSSFPEDGLPATLTRLFISGCRRLEALPREMMAKLTSLEFLEIENSCDSMRSFSLGICPKLSSLTIKYCENLESLSIEEVDDNLSHLEDLIICRCPNFVSFPQGGLPTPNLTALKVRGCENLKSLPGSLEGLTALRQLTITDAPNLLSFAEAGLLPNLEILEIWGCGRLRPTLGKDWGLQGLDILEI